MERKVQFSPVELHPLDGFFHIQLESGIAPWLLAIGLRLTLVISSVHS